MNLDITHTLLIISTLSTIIFTEDSRFDFGLMENTELLEVLRQEDLELTAQLEKENKRLVNEKIASFIQEREE